MPWPIPQINDENRAFWTGGTDGELRVERCQACGYYLHPPSPRCPECWSDDIDPEAVSGRGTVYTYTINRQHMDARTRGPLRARDRRTRRAVRSATDDDIVDCTTGGAEIGMAVEIAFVAARGRVHPALPPAAS